APQAKVGYACCPGDGCDADTLLAGGRAAAAEAPPATTLAATRAARTLEIGRQRVLIADPAMSPLYGLIERVARPDLPVLICGERGSGKELAASAVHHWSKRAAGRLVAVNCAALPEHLVESELFGHERGAFTGATTTKEGLFERGSGGTVLLDEVGELP